MTHTDRMKARQYGFVKGATKPTHTPGPWHNSSTNYGYTNLYVCGPKCKDGSDYAPICIANGEANARLIAAAPELLKKLSASTNMLAMILELVDRKYGKHLTDQIALNKAALAKARGK